MESLLESKDISMNCKGLLKLSSTCPLIVWPHMHIDMVQNKNIMGSNLFVIDTISLSTSLRNKYRLLHSLRNEMIGFTKLR